MFVLVFVCVGQGLEEYSFVSRINSILLRQAQGGGVSESGHEALFGLLPSFASQYQLSRGSTKNQKIFALFS